VLQLAHGNLQWKKLIRGYTAVSLLDRGRDGRERKGCRVEERGRNGKERRGKKGVERR